MYLDAHRPRTVVTITSGHKPVAVAALVQIAERCLKRALLVGHYFPSNTIHSTPEA